MNKRFETYRLSPAMAPMTVQPPGMKRLLFLLPIVFAPMPGCADGAGKVVGIPDGDTITVLSGRTPTGIRPHGIDAPETGQDFGGRAKQVASELAFGKRVTLRPVTRDRYGRTVAEVILPEGRSMNREMVGHEAVWWYREYAPRDGGLARLEDEAKTAGWGLWSQSNPVPPWTWRGGDATRMDVVGNRSSRVYHRPHCSSLGRMRVGNHVPFGTAAEAETRGYRRAGDCR